MIHLGSAIKVHLLAGGTDMRLGFEGLYALARGLLHDDPLSGHVFGFCNKNRNRVKFLYWDGSGLWISAKRLEEGRFAWPQQSAAAVEAQSNRQRAVVMSQAELTLLLNGIDLATTRKRKWYRVDQQPGC
jgi:transposase